MFGIFRIFAFISGTIAIALSSHMIYKYLKNRKRLAEMKEMKKRLEMSRRERKAKNKDDNSQENLCIVCSENPKEVDYYLLISTQYFNY